METTAAAGAAPPYRLTENASLAAYTSFAVRARAARFAEVRDARAIPDILAAADGPVLILGGGSNVLFTRDYPGLVVHLATRGITSEQAGASGSRVRVAAGEIWDSFVRWSLTNAFSGLENLILIPGSVGAAPIQNIGAYGVEVADFIAAVRAWDRSANAWHTLTREECAFEYRDSIFKREPGRFVVTEVIFELPRQRPLVLDYAGVRDELAAMGVAQATPLTVGAAVERLRRRKLPDPMVLGNAGSFFKNPVVSEVRAAELRTLHPGMPVYPLGGQGAKLSAAWLIEQCGFKGFREGDAGVSDKHALVLVNYGDASGAEIWALAQKIRTAVAERFGCELEPEPRIV